MDARRQYRYKITLFVALFWVVNAFWATVAPSQPLHPADTPERILYRLNAGGSRVAAIDNGPDWLSDAAFYGGGTRVVTGRNVRGIDRSVPTTTPPNVFKTERYNPPNTPNMTYDLPVDEHTQIELRFYFMNGFERTSKRGERVFDVEVDGNVVLHNVDLSDVFGHQIGGMRSVVLKSDGEINIVFHRNVQAPLVSAIEVVVVKKHHNPTPVTGVLYRLNAGGPRVAAIDGGPDWLSDAGFYSGGSRVVMRRRVRGLTHSVPSSTPREVFETERYNPPNTLPLRYDFEVEAGTEVDVRLYVMNGWNGTSAPGERVFDVEINGHLVLDDIDLSAESGHQIGSVRSVKVKSDGYIIIVFRRQVQAPLINAIELVVTDDTPVVEINPRRSLIETNPAVLSGFDLRTILRKVAENSDLTPAPERHYQQMIDAYNRRPVTPGAQACRGTLNGFRMECNRLEGEQLHTLDAWFPIALVNRIDLAPMDGRHCGQQRIILANNTEIGNERMFIILEAQIPNPNPSCGVQGCRPIAAYWEALSDIDSPRRRNELHKEAFLHGLPSLLAEGVEPFMAAAFLGPQGGQLRTNNFNDHPWTLREFRIQRTDRAMSILPAPVADSPNGRLWNDTSAAFARRPQCRTSILDAIAGLLTDDPAQMSFVVDESCKDAESRNDGSQEYIFELAEGRVNGFRSEIAARIRELQPGSRLTPEDMAERAHFAGSCIGCHEEANGKELGNGVEAPFSAGFVHVNEFFDEEDCGDGTHCFEISPALVDVFLPHRKAVIERFLAAPKHACRRAEPSQQLWLQQSTPRAADVMRTLGGQPANVKH